ncbi:hypothetical protein [Rickettsia endosymbiont of Cardiosporidium cionae]|uniref:hypothetical protein n=1 Tax=Rickettsia endosymbiont of Cardiosporidium cionae TaxID=2777155 RepID=UPI0018962BFE|nr:hypothetical protein [Rickettsia endosymbiont of Cardiosporidium cionae]KAF8818685.1 hypothetical protein IHI24_000410 [Rickettsia endosymbiont of Cardiosporidium cionae]
MNIKQIIYHARSIQHLIRRDQLKLGKILQRNVESNEKFNDISSKELYEDLCNHLKYMRDLFIEFNQKILSSKILDQISFDVRTNKMVECYNFVLDILKGTNPEILDINPTDAGEDFLALLNEAKMPLFDNSIVKNAFNNNKILNTAFWGTSNTSFLSLILISTVEMLTKQSMYDITGGDCYIVKCFSLPKSLNIDSVLVHKNYMDSICTIPIVHSWYSFGGSRKEQYKPCNPQDCSSSIELYYAHNKPQNINFTTFDLSMIGNSLNPAACNSNRSLSINYLRKLFDTTDTPNPGDIYCHRQFKDKNLSGIGHAGHAAIVLDNKIQHGKIQTLSFNRNQPKKEGILVEEFDVIQKPLYQKCFLKPKYDVYKTDLLTNIWDDKIDANILDNYQYESFKDLGIILGDCDQLIEQQI